MIISLETKISAAAATTTTTIFVDVVAVNQKQFYVSMPILQSNPLLSELDIN